MGVDPRETLDAGEGQKTCDTPGAFGVLMGVAGLTGWDLHPTALTSLLS